MENEFFGGLKENGNLLYPPLYVRRCEHSKLFII